MAHHQFALDSVDEAISLISSLAAGMSFFQIKGKIENVSAKLQELTHVSEQFEVYGPIIASLSQLAMNSAPTAIANILDLLRELRTQIEYTRAQDEALETERRQLWEAELNDLTNQRNNLTDRRNTLTGNIENYGNIIVENEDKTVFHSGEFERFVVLFNDQEVWCQ